MKKNVIPILVIVALILGSCDPCKRLWKKCPPVIVDSVRVDSIWRLDTLLMISPSDTVYLGEAFLHEIGIAVEDEDQKVTVKEIEGQKIVEFICKEDSLKKVISILEYQLNSQRTFVKEVIKPIYITKNSRYHTLAGILTPILSILLIGAIVIVLKLLFKK